MSVRSAASQIERERIRITRMKLQVRRQLLNLDLDPGTSAMGSPCPMDVSGQQEVAEAAGGITPPPKAHFLQVPKFRVSGPTTLGSAPDNVGQVDATAHQVAGAQDANETRPQSITANRHREREELLIQLEELNLQEDELALTMPEEKVQADLRSEASESQHRVHQWVNNTQNAVTGHQTRNANELPSFNPPVNATTHEIARDWNATGNVTRRDATGVSATWADKFFENFATADGDQELTSEQVARRLGGIPELPILEGKRAEWVAFLICYRTSTADYGLRNSENLPRLQRVIKGNALKLLRGSLMFPHQVPEAIDRLEKFYGTPDKLLGEAEDILFKLPQMQDPYSHLALYSGEVSYTVAVIQLAKESLRNLTLIRMLERKFHPSLGMAWAKKKTKECTLTSLKQFLDDTLEYAVSANINVMEVGPKAAKQNPPRNQPVLVAVNNEPLQQSLSPRPQPRQEACLMGCNSAHGLEECSLFLSLPADERKVKCTQRRCCYKCLKVHQFGRCRSRGCTVAGCGGNHHSLLHKDPEPFVGLVWPKEMGIIYRVLPVRVEFGGRAVDCHAFLDCGASLSFVNRNVADALGVPAPDKTVPVSWLDDEARSVVAKEVNLSVLDDSGNWRPLNCLATDLILPRQTVTSEGLKRLNIDVEVPLLNDVRPDILIGLNNGHLTRITDCQPSSSCNSVSAVKTVLGWCLEGNLSSVPSSGHVLLAHDVKLEKVVRDYINQEVIGLIDEDGPPRSVQDQQAIALMEKGVRRVGNRFQCPLLWKDADRIFPDSKDMAMKRFLALEKKLKNDPTVGKKVKEMMRHYINQGYARVVTHDTADSRRCWYLPTFLVQNASKPEKIRLVWDAAAKVKGVSLNDHLLSGPDLNEPLIFVLQRMRQGPLAVMGDVSEMYHQIVVPEEDRSAMRFFWRDDGGDLQLLEMCVMSFGATCSPTIAQFTKNLNAEQHKDEFPEAALSIQKNTYVDDWGISRWSTEDLMAMINDVVKINSAANFSMHKWLTNDVDLARFLDAEMESSGLTSLNDNKVLGMQWNVKQDAFVFIVSPIILNLFNTYECRPTKREVLRCVMSIFDPLGLISFITVGPKILMRELWSRQIEWEEQIPAECVSTWSAWIDSLRRVEMMSFPRWYGTQRGPVEIHVFTDASERVMAAVAYIVQRSATGEVVIALVGAKCKLAPINSKSIPRQELDAFLVGTKLLRLVKRGLDLDILRVRLWTDAQDVLYWLTSTGKRFTPFIMARVNAIRSASTQDEWGWVPSSENPADWATKSVNTDNEAELWCNGPSFLRSSESDWPVWKCPLSASVNEEVSRVLIVKSEMGSIIHRAQYISRWRILVRAVVRVERFTQLLRLEKKERLERKNEKISDDEEHFAITRILLATQRDLCAKDLRGLSPGKDENGLVRMQSRIEKASEVPYELRFPVILPQKHPVTKLIFAYYHHKMGHDCHSRALVEIRRRGYVCVGMRRQLNEVVRTCNTCILRRALPEQPEMGLLPRARMGFGDRPFTNTGVDLFGPVDVVIGRRREKRWGVLFVCLTVRAVHLEVVHSLSARSLCMAIDNFVNRRRVVPREFRCDNGTNFIAASKTYASPDGRQPVWRFNPPGTPHMGGAWERLVGSVKRAIDRMKLKDVPSDEEFRHLVAAAEGIVNSRPLTEFPVDSKEQLPITPNDVLHGYAEAGVDVLVPRSIAEMTKEREKNVTEFWRRFVSEYLPSISARPKWHKRVTPLQVGDLVLLAEGSVRSAWRRGIVEDIVLDPLTKQVRDVKIRTPEGNVYRRGAAKVAPIRVNGEGQGK